MPPMGGSVELETGLLSNGSIAGHNSNSNVRKKSASSAPAQYTGLSIITAQIVCEVCKQLSVYSFQYFNGGRYPVPRQDQCQ